MNNRELWKKRGLRALIVVVATVSCFFAIEKGKEDLGNTSNVQEEYLNTVQSEKIQELEKAEGFYSEDSIVLDDTSKEQAEMIADQIGGKLRMTKDGDYAAIYLPEDTTIDEVYENEKYRAYLEEMSPDYYVSISALDANNNELFSARPEYSVTDADYINQQYLDYINIKDAWNVSRGSGVKVAVIDTGIDTDHEEFAGRISDKSYNASIDKVVSDYGLEVIEDEQGHGTAVAGVISAAMDNQVGITGIAPEAELVVIKCECDASGQFTRGSDLMFGLAYAIECDVDVINMSFGTEEDVFSKYTKLAVDSDIICVASAGNDGISIPTYPAADENVIGVGALEMSDWSLASYSNFGDNSEIIAPGTAYTTTIGGGYGYETGTSISSPVVSATVALYLASHPNTEYSEILELVKASSVDLGTLGEDWYNGYGALDIYAFLCEEKGSITYEMLTDEVGNQNQIFVKGHSIQYMQEPERENVVFDGWYYDMECTDECEYYTDTFTSDVTLYAKWINEDEGSAYVYTILDDGTVEIQSYTGKRRYLTVPSVIEGRSVTSIGMDAFANNSRIRTIVLPSTLTNIADRAFYNCTSLRGVDIPEQVKNIGAYAFSCCVRLNNVGIAANGALTEIADEAFSQCGIAQFTIPSKVSNIGNRVFAGSTSMRKIAVAEGNTTYQVVKNALYDATGKYLLYYPAALSGEYVVNDATIGIADSAFAYARISSIDLPEGLESIGDRGFLASGIRSVRFPSTLSFAGERVFEFCNYLTTVEFSDEIRCTDISERMFGGCNVLQKIQIPAGIKVIGIGAFANSGLSEISFAERSVLETIQNEAFSYCPLQNVELPNSLKKIGSSAFAYCGNLSQLTFAENSKCESVGENAFKNCQLLKMINFPDSLKSVERLAFFGSGLTKVEIGAGLLTLGDGAFAGCSELKSFVVDSGNTEYASYEDVLFTKDKTELILYPGAREGTYTLPQETIYVRGYAFASAEKLTKVNFSSSLKEIGEYAFSRCTSMVTPTLPEQIETIGANAFEYCSSMTERLVLPKSIISVGRYAFFNDYGLTEIVIASESEMSRISYGAFAYCGIADFTVPGNVATMGQEIFTGCKNLLTVTYEADSRLENLAAWTFEGADELRQITFEEGSALTLIEARACQGLDKLEKVDLTYCTKLNKIGNYAFNYCKSLANVVLPQSLAEIGRYAFNGCTTMSKLEVSKSVSFIGRYAFAGTGNIEIFFKASVLPSQVEENWDYGVAGYYMGVSGVQTSGDWKYALTDDNKASVISYSGSDANIVLDTLDGHEVVSIGGTAFQNNTTLQSISLPDTLTGIYQAAFAGTKSLDSITIPANVVVIDNEAFRGSGINIVEFASNSRLSTLGRNAFAETANLVAIALPDGVTKIRDYTFYKSNLSQISFGTDTTLTEIGRYAFAKSAIQDIVLPEKLEKIDYYAFSECDRLSSIRFGIGSDLQIFGNAFYRSALTAVSIPENISYIGELCFTGCGLLTDIEVAETNKNYSSINGVLFDKAAKKLITCPAGKTGSYEIAGTVTVLAFAAFEDSKLSEVILPEDSQLSTIGYRAFYNCKNLTSINIPSGVQSIENYAFAYDDRLESVTVAENSQLGGIYKSAFYNCTKLTGFMIPAGVQEIAEYAFYGCSAMSNVQIAEDSQLKGVYGHAFEYSGITEFVMPDNLQEIGGYAFRGAKVATLICNESITDIGDYAFADCGLENTKVLTVPGTVEYLGNGALQGAFSLEELTIPFVGRYQDDIVYGRFGNLFGLTMGDSSNDFSIHTVYVLKGSVIPEAAFYCWNKVKKIYIPDSVTTIKSAAFTLCGIESFYFPRQLQEIEGDDAFYGTKIQVAELPDSLKSIGDGVFLECAQLQEVKLPDSLENIGVQAFAGTSIHTIEIPAGVQKIGGGAFSDCNNLANISVAEENSNYCSRDGILYNKKLTEILIVPAKLTGKIVVPEGVTVISDYAFKGTNISEISLPNSLTEIGIGAFRSAEKLEKIVIPDSVKTVGRDCFLFASNLKEAVIGNGVESIEKGIFFHCIALKTVEINGDISEIGAQAFYYCYALEDVELNGNLEIIGEEAFFGCHSLQNITLPENVTTIRYRAFYQCSSLVYINIPKNVSLIEHGAFSECTKLCRIIVDEENKNYCSVDGVVYDKERTTLICVPHNIEGDIVIPEGVETLEDEAFVACDKITSVTLPQSLKKIGDSCFFACYNLESISLGDKIESIGNGAFSATKFYDNGANWENGALYIGRYLLEVKANTTSLRVKQGTLVIGGGAAADNEKLQRVILPDTVRYINDQAFSNCTNLRMFRNSKNLKKLGKWAFMECNNLRSIVISGGLEGFGEIPFGDCKRLNCVKIESEISLEENTLPLLFSDCPIESVFIPNQNCSFGAINGMVERIIIDSENEEDLVEPHYPADVYSKVNASDVTVDRGERCYYQGEWNLVTFYEEGTIIQMTPVKVGEAIQFPATSLIIEYLPEGAEFIGWDINGDGMADKLPTTLTEDLEANAVYDVPISSISTEEEIEIEVGRTKELEITCTPVEYSQSDEVIWESSDETVATVNETGMVTAVAEGTAIITATLKDNSAIQTACNVTVIPIQYGIKLTETSSEVNVGNTMEITPEYVLPESDSDITTWQSSDEAVATVVDGVVTAITPGDTTIRIVHGSYSAEYYLTVKAPLKNITLNLTETALNVGDTKQLEVTYDPINTTDIKEVLWYSNKTSVARVNADGLITAVGPGQATITGILGKMEVTCNVTVSAPLKWIVLNTTTGTMRIDRTKQLEVIYEPSNTTDDKTAVWSSSDEAVASVDEKGFVTAHKAGTAVVTAMVGAHNATYTVTVVGIKDKNTGIIITNSDDTPMDETISMDVREMDTETVKMEYKSAWERFLEFLRKLFEEAVGHKELTTVFDISLLQENVTIQPDKTVDVEIPVPEDMLPEDVVIYRMEEDGTITDMHAEYVDGRFRFKTDHFSVYAIGAKSKIIYVDSITLPQKNINLCVGQTAAVNAVITPETAENKEIIWKSADETIATVDMKGVVTAVSEGTVEMTGTAADGGGAIVTTMVTVGHTWNTGEVITNPTCTAKGEKIYKCTNCTTTRTEEVAALGHKFSEKWTVDKASTCKEEGSQSHHCTRENCTEKTDVTVIPKGVHTWNTGEVTANPTCTVKGEKTYKCTNCTTTRTEEVVALGHKFSEEWTVDKASTCKEEGSQSHHCTRENCTEKTDVTVIPKGVHTWNTGEVTTNPTCTVKGERTYKCTNCTTTRTEEVPALGHEFSEEWTVDKASTCKEEGSQSHHCARENCTEKTDVTVIPKGVHTWNTGEVTTNPTCTVKGEKTYKCTNCATTKTEEVSALGHEFSEEWTVDKEATCKEEGSKCRQCVGKDCTEKADITVIPKTEHTWNVGDATTQPACTEKGEMVYTCEACSETKVEEVLAKGHEFATEWTIDEKASYNQNGTKSHHCTRNDCAEKSDVTTILAPTEITVSNEEYVYTGNTIKPDVLVTDSAGTKLLNETDYIVSYPDESTDVGMYKVKIEFVGDYTGEQQITYTVVPKGTSLKKPAFNGKEMVLRWKKQSKQTTGYELQYSTNSKFKKKATKTVTVKKNKKTEKIIKKIKMGKKYYVRIRTYKKIKLEGKSQKLYSGWSKVKKITTE